MDSLLNTWRYAEAVLPPQLAAYGTWVFAASVILPVLLILGKPSAARGAMVVERDSSPPPLPAVLLRRLCRGGRKGQYVCLLGLSDSGKTLLFMRVGHVTSNPQPESI